MGYFTERTLDEKIPFEANTTKSIKIPRDRFIQKVKLRLNLTGDTAGAVTAAEDSPMSIVRAIRLVANGNDTRIYEGMSDMYYVDKYEYGTPADRYINTTINQSNLEIGRAFSTMDFVIDVKNTFELPAMLPAHQFSSLDLFIDWGAAADLGTGYTVDSGFIEVHLREAQLSADEIRKVGTWLTIKESAIEKNIDTSNTDYTFAIDLPVGSMMRRTVITAYRAGVRSDTEIPKYKITQESPIKQEIFQTGWEISQAVDKIEYQLESIISGMTIMDYESLGGLDLRRLKEGDVKLKANTLAPSGATKIRLLNQEIF
jgi:hypothetical protein